eukprot:TRINITY_DN10729_c0_g1_i1.p1 TRINITY_DN10729_c0_g1~~TRINITY_DN10729_c0_g1_i1.p1  ORF type:complete len:755 (+),score=205.72 TRINITY_DN10729_c0_g1_i1:477-2741(+)
MPTRPAEVKGVAWTQPFAFELSKDEAEHRVLLADLCFKARQEKLSLPDAGPDRLLQLIVENVFAACRSGDAEARLMIPRILSFLTQPGMPPWLCSLVRLCSASVPEWMFIQWQPQLLALMSTSSTKAVAHTLERLCRTYPQALLFSVILAEDQLNEAAFVDEETRSEFETLKEALGVAWLHGTELLEQLFLLHDPDLMVKDLRDELTGFIDEKKYDQATLRSKLQRAVANARERFQSDSLRKRCKDFSLSVVKLLSQVEADLRRKEPKTVISDATKRFRNVAMSKREIEAMRKAYRLSNYTKALAEFQADAACRLEIPGQYDGSSKPMPEQHVHIKGFGSDVKILPSIRRPKRVTLLGDDEASYPFLVKAGEDLRTDDRMQQVFSVMNSMLRKDPVCSKQYLSLRRYAVVPMSTRVGVLEWMEGTTTLKDFFREGLTSDKGEHAAVDAMAVEYTNFLNKYSKSGGVDPYIKCMTKGTASDVTRSFHRRVAMIRATVVRDQLKAMADSPEAFFNIRQHFGRTVSTMNACHYVLGIGDRHLSNSMVDLTSGAIVGIDFGHNFGSATQLLPVPELFPFRLTRQMESVFVPHSRDGLLRHVMIHVMRCLRDNADSLVSVLEVFVNEPTLDWQQHARKVAVKTFRSGSDAGGSQVASSLAGSSDATIDNFAKGNIMAAEAKLRGEHPASIMVRDLAKNKKIKDGLSKVKEIVLGQRDSKRRALPLSAGLPVEDQVDCLLDMATDPSILGRAWKGWEPYI